MNLGFRVDVDALSRLLNQEHAGIAFKRAGNAIFVDCRR